MFSYDPDFYDESCFENSSFYDCYEEDYYLDDLARDAEDLCNRMLYGDLSQDRFFS